MRVVVTGLVATYPVGGVAWDYVQYALGFRQLDCDVWYLEDTGRWLYDPRAETFTADVAWHVRYLGETLAWFDPALAGRWALRDPAGRCHGPAAAGIERLVATADLFLNVSGSCWLRDAYRGARVKAYVDTDPCYNQARLVAATAPDADENLRFSAGLVRAHDVFFTTGEHIGAADCLVPTAGLAWKPTRPPIVPDRWRGTESPGDAFTTVMSWQIEPPSPVVDGHTFGGKDVEFPRILELPGRVPEPLEVALSGPAPRDRLRAAGWRLRDAHTVSDTPAAYRRYLQRSRGELSIAKNAYVATHSGWFSTRSAAYLACGRPVVVQDTGFPAHVPTGPGLHAFRTADEAVAAIAAVRADYGAACAHARDTAVAHFAAADVCRRLLADAGF